MLLTLIDKWIDYFVYGFGIIAVLLAAFSAYLEKNNKQNKLKKHITTLTLIAAICGSITLLSQWRKDYIGAEGQENLVRKSDDFFTKTTNAQKQIKIKTDTISMYQKYLQDSTAILIKGQSKTLSKLDASVINQNNLVKAQRETIKQILGEGFPTIFFYQRDKMFYDASIINSNSEFSLFDCNIQIYDFNKLKIDNFREEGKTLFYSRDSLINYSKNIQGFDVSPSVLLALNYNVKKEDLPKYYYIKSITRNCIVHQYSMLNIIDGRVIHSFKIFKQKNNNWDLIKFQDTIFIKSWAWKKFLPYKKQIRDEYY
jgi:hypothetical protein